MFLLRNAATKVSAFNIISEQRVMYIMKLCSNLFVTKKKQN